ncbi:unnamed protein product [Diamesa tonsa]
MEVKYLVIFSLLGLIGNSIGFLNNQKWQCKNNTNCAPFMDSNALDANVTLQNVYENQDICRLLCGGSGSLWPQPTGAFSLGKSVVSVNPLLIRFEYPDGTAEVKDFFEQASFLFLKSLNEECNGECSAPTDGEMFIKIEVNSDSMTLSPSTNESYFLKVSTIEKKSTVTITAETSFGARHGLETLTQLIAKTTDEFNRNSLVVTSPAEINDKPVYQHRGLLLDTARHFIPVPHILRTLDGMGSCKLNVFHWHITDSQSFPFESKRLPQINEYGVFAKDKIYKQSEIKDIVQYAKYRGIRVILELDAPAHAGNGFQWGPDYGMGDIAVCVNQQPWRKYCIEPSCGQLNPANPNLYSVLKDIYQEMRDVKDVNEFFHMGGDEIFFGCWNSTPEITNYMQTKGWDRSVNGFLLLWSEFQSKVLAIWDEVTNRNDSIILWSSDLTNPKNIEKYLPKERYIIQTWLPNTATIPKELMRKGYRVIISTKNAWYFDHGFWGTTSYYNWKKVYSNRIPRDSLVLGGEACMWTEFCDEHGMDAKIWPRLAAVAERLWADPTANVKFAESRLNRHRERLIRKGIQPDAVTPEYCTIFEGECG